MMIKFLSVKGEVLILDKEAQQTKAAIAGMIIDQPGSYEILSTRSSRAEIKFNSSIFTLKESSRINISVNGEPVITKQPEKTVSSFIKLTAGNTWSSIVKMIGSNKGGKITAPNAVAGVRG